MRGAGMASDEYAFFTWSPYQPRVCIESYPDKVEPKRLQERQTHQHGTGR